MSNYKTTTAAMLIIKHRNNNNTRLTRKQYDYIINNKKQLSCSFCPFPAIKCPDITVDENVLVTGNRLQSSYGNVLQFGCRNRLLALYGPLHIRCEGNGQWNEGPPTCDGIVASLLASCCWKIQIYYCSFCIFNYQSFF